MGKIKAQLDSLKTDITFLAKGIVERQCLIQPELNELGPKEMVKLLEDTKSNLEYLFAAVEVDSKGLFEQYNRWMKVMMIKHDLPLETMTNFYICTETVFGEKLSNWQISKGLHDKLHVCMHYGKYAFDNEVKEPTSFLVDDNPFKESLIKYSEAVFTSDKNAMAKLINDCTEKGMEIGDIYKHILQPFQRELGLMWQNNKLSVAEEHYATALTEFAMSMLYEKIITKDKNGKVILGACVQGELHDLGLRVVCDYMESQGWNAYYLGADMPDSALIKMIKEKKPDIIALSCTMAFNIAKLHDLVSAIKAAGIKTPIIVGGYPFQFDKQLCAKVGATAYASDFEEMYSLACKNGDEVHKVGDGS